MKKSLIASTLLSAFLLTACGGEEKAAETPAPATQAATQAPAAGDAKAEYTQLATWINSIQPTLQTINQERQAHEQAMQQTDPKDTAAKAKLGADMKNTLTKHIGQWKELQTQIQAIDIKDAELLEIKNTLAQQIAIAVATSETTVKLIDSPSPALMEEINKLGAEAQTIAQKLPPLIQAADAKYGQK